MRKKKGADISYLFVSFLILPSSISYFFFPPVLSKEKNIKEHIYHFPPKVFCSDLYPTICHVVHKMIFRCFVKQQPLRFPPSALFHSPLVSLDCCCVAVSYTVMDFNAFPCSIDIE